MTTMTYNLSCSMIRIVLVCALIVGHALTVNTQQAQPAAPASDYAYRQCAHLTNSIGPRLTGSPQAQAAVEYVAGEMRRLGLEVHLEKVMVPHWVRGEETASLV